MFEVYTGTKPGRPTVLALLTAGALVGTLGLAWTQVRGSLALGDEVAIEGTPLKVRPPLGWLQSPQDPQVFGKWVRKRGWRRDVWAAERKLEFYSGDFLFQYTQMFEAAAVSPAQPTQIAGGAGMQYQWLRRRRDGPTFKIYRVVSTPELGQIGVEYTPLGEVSHGDLQLMDVVCDAIRLDESRPRGTSADIKAYVGIDFAVSPDQQIVGPDNLDGPTLWLQRVEEGRPVWALGVVRRYVPGRPAALQLLGLEAKSFMTRSGPQEGERGDKAYLAVEKNREAERGGSVFVSLWLIAKSPAEAALVYVLADPRWAEEAHAAAKGFVERVEFVSAYPR